MNTDTTSNVNVEKQTGSCCAPPEGGRTVEIKLGSCGCESAPPSEGEAACCEAQAAKFGVEAGAKYTCCS